MRIVFMGTPDFAAAILKEVTQWEGGEVIAVYAQPDRPAGRGKKLKEPDTKVLAKALGIPVYQPANFREDQDVDTLKGLKPDVLVVAAYGLLLPQRVLNVPPMGAFNVHASLLPQYRGAAPIQRAVMHGDTVTGVTIMRIEAGLDTGPILLQQAVSIEPEDTSGTMFTLLAEHGAKLMVGALGMINEGRAAFIPQNNDLATQAGKISRAEEDIAWGKSAESVHNQIRGLTPFPGARTEWCMEGRDSLSLRIEPGAVEILSDDTGKPSTQPGTVLGYQDGALRVACGEGVYLVTHLRPAGKGTMTATDFRNGRLHGQDTPYGIMRSADAAKA